MDGPLSSIALRSEEESTEASSEETSSGNCLSHFVYLHVVNAIYAFAVLGVVKMLLCVFWLWNTTSSCIDDDRSDQKLGKLFSYTTVYLF